jgi:hypothetical protein
MPRFLFVFLFSMIVIAAKAQQPKFIDQVEHKINLYGIKNQSPLLFVHFDKNVYSNNENIWFAAYLLNCYDAKRYKTLSVALINDDSRKVVMEDRFVITNAMAFGNTFVPDSVGPGNYSFVVTTNRLLNGQAEVVFTQPVTVKTADKQSYTASLNPLDTAINAPQQKVLLLVNFNETLAAHKQPPFVQVSYYIGNNQHPVLKDSVKVQRQYELNIPSKLLSPGNNKLHVQIKYKDETQDISMMLPVPPGPTIVRFYPEGGTLVNNIQSTIGWEVKSSAGSALSVNAILYRDKTIIDTIETNSYGLGRFKLIPKAGSKYYVRLYNVNKKDTLYKLPDAINQGPVLALPSALANDSLTVTLKDDRHEKLYLIGHNYQQVFFNLPVDMTATTKNLTLVIKDIPRGVMQLTLTDSVGRPFAERLCFAHYDQKKSLNIASDKTEYATRQKVTVKIKLDGKPDNGLVSIACVQENRLEIKKKQILKATGI